MLHLLVLSVKSFLSIVIVSEKSKMKLQNGQNFLLFLRNWHSFKKASLDQEQIQ
jgi:hypothetical protein